MVYSQSDNAQNFFPRYPGSLINYIFSRYSEWLRVLLFLIIPVVFFWRPGQFFFILDEWLALWGIVTDPLLQFINCPDAEMWTPFSRLVFYILIRGIGNHYDILLLINCLGTGLNAYLFYLFSRVHIRKELALSISLFYAAAAVHSATAQMAYYINIILCLGFLLGALLLTSRYLQDPSLFKLSAIGLLALLSMLSWNFTILAIWAIPLSAFCGKKRNSKRAFLSLTLVIAIAFGVFSLGYFHYAGIRSMGAHNPNILTSFLTIRYLEHWFLGSFVSPFCYVLWGRGLNLIESLFCSLSLLIPILLIIGVWGTDQEKRLGLWCVLVNALPFLLVSLARFQFPLFQALSHRYGVLTLLWGLLLIGKAWEILARHLPASPWFQVLLPLAILVVMIYGQVSPTPRIREIYLGLAKRARVCYQSLPNKADNFSLQEANQPFCPELPPWINKKQGVIIKQFLTGS